MMIDEIKKNTLRSVSSYGSNLVNFSNEVKNDYDVVLAAVSNSGLSLQYASAELKTTRK